MKLKPDELLDLLNTIDRLGYGHFRLEQDGLLLEVGRDGAGDPAGHAAEPRATTAADVAPGESARPASRSGMAAPDSTAAQPGPAAGRAGLVAVRAPMTGTFYGAPEPGAPPFVEPGARVGADETVCIIEVMKLFNSIPAGTAGTVEEIAVADEATVSVGDALLWIRPE